MSRNRKPEPLPAEIACNRCNEPREPSAHPCPRCRCPEYRITKYAKETNA